MQKIRSILFDIAFYTGSVILVIILLPLLLGPRRWAAIPPWLWSLMTDFLARKILGLRYEVEGWENVPELPFIIACKHQSAWETLVMSKLFPGCVFVLKQELMYIPLVQLYFKRQRSIAVNRKLGIKAIKNMVEQAKPILEDKQPIFIFPEGTRVSVGDKGEYHPGVAALYKELNVPVVPIALNSGLFWGRRHFIKKSGVIKVVILPLINPGLNRKEFMAKLETCIEEKTAELCQIGDKNA